MIMPEESHLLLSRHDDITVVGFNDATILDAYHVNEVAQELYQLIEKDGCRKLVLDLGTIKILSSQTLGVLLNMRQKLAPLDGKVVISGIDPRLYRVFKVTKLQDIFEFYDTSAAAVSALRQL